VKKPYKGLYGLDQQAKQVMSEGGFNFRKWNTNLLQLMMTTQVPEGQEIPDDSITSESDDQATLSKLLGITWNSQTDEFMFKINS